MKRNLFDWIFRWFSGDTTETWGSVPPGAEAQLVFGEPDDDGEPMHVATTYNNDGFELWIGYRNGGWNFFCKAEHARRLAWFILWDWWIVSTWFGLKRKIWYWALRHKLQIDREHTRRVLDGEKIEDGQPVAIGDNRGARQANDSN